MVRVSWTEVQKGFFGGNYVDLTVGETPEAGCLQTGCGCCGFIIVAYCLISSLFYYLNNADNSNSNPAREQAESQNREEITFPEKTGPLAPSLLFEVLDSSYVNGMARLTISIENTSNQGYYLFFTPEDMELTSLSVEPLFHWKLYIATNPELDPLKVKKAAIDRANFYPPGEIKRHNLHFRGPSLRDPGGMVLEGQLTWRTETAEGKVPLSGSVYLNIFRR